MANKRCPDCGYTREDAGIHMDHHLCRNKGFFDRTPAAAAKSHTHTELATAYPLLAERISADAWERKTLAEQCDWALHQAGHAWSMLTAQAGNDAANAATIETQRGRIAGLEKLQTPRPFDDWHEDCGPVLWHVMPICEPPYCGTPLDRSWPYDGEGYRGHVSETMENLVWTPLPNCEAITERYAALAQKGGQ